MYCRKSFFRPQNVDHRGETDHIVEGPFLIQGGRVQEKTTDLDYRMASVLVSEKKPQIACLLLA